MSPGFLLPSVAPAIDWGGIDDALTGGESVSGEELLVAGVEGATIPVALSTEEAGSAIAFASEVF